MGFYKKYLIKIVYENGFSQAMWFWKFNYEYEGGNKKASWLSADKKQRPLHLNVGDVNSIWVIDTKTVFKFKNPNPLED